MTARKITPFIGNLSELGHTIRKDIKDIHDNHNQTSEEHEKLRHDIDNRFTAIKARTDSIHEKLKITQSN